MNKRQLQAIETKERIMKTAKELCKKYTYDKLSVDLICKEAGVSVGAFYHHFKSKHGLIIEGYWECDKFFQEKIIGKLRSKDPIERILEYIDYQMEYALNIGIDLMTEVYKTQITEGTSFFLKSSRSLPHGLQNLVKEAQQKGAITKGDSIENITCELLLLSRGVIYNWCQNNGSYDLRLYCHKVISNHMQCFKA
ncbi:TetR/AcrR family transcriptional regulator [Vallitalea sp.]|uniref:TetR/AcrR family transcriptional regulator n=1 Tax=Vallitalea sp. TaxID=1882829 RepID=UPI0025F6E41E|nr:TetR/AcrR family transcriptional regulator [Vallitalea sp.]MCT4687101.1 TetR/AcrR family transcriptional regulator [Vallitalea sp.]